MSGGAFDYQQHHIHDIADRLSRRMNNNHLEDGDGYSEETIKKMRQGWHELMRAYVFAQRIDWLLSGDDSEESFHRRLEEELGDLEL